MIFLSLRAGSLGEREPARIPMMIACRLSIRMSHMSINNNQSAQTGNTFHYCKHKPINVELHLYYIVLYSFVSFVYRPPLGHTKKVKTARFYSVIYQVVLFITICKCFCRHSRFKVVYYPLTNSVVWNWFMLQ